MYQAMTSLLLCITSTAVCADELTFRCNWGQGDPFEIVIDQSSSSATRSDGGSTYDVLKIHPEAVWLRVRAPFSNDLAVQVIERREYGAGRWADVVIAADGTVSSVSDGQCREVASSK
ncbi:hypothetical protein [Limimaricola pyoseonensis]|uniref:hypothetical protein n=1 Tax=Limimaricola pyoseonensis TaxID=521013 RepID=UPI0010427E03|nr:hypothetical protein [Limimaricola pyoseonensis]